jgi:hypothetical protein
VCRFGVLLVARLLALVLSAVEWSFTGVVTLEEANPVLDSGRTICSDVCLTALLFIPFVATKDILLNLSTITSSWNANLTGSTKSFVARPIAHVLSTWHQLATDIPATPTILVVGINASSSG